MGTKPRSSAALRAFRCSGAEALASDPQSFRDARCSRLKHLLVVGCLAASSTQAQVSIVRPATQDAWVSVSSASSTHNSNPLVVGMDDFGGQDLLIQFDVSSIPLDSPILSADLYLEKTGQSVPSVPVHKIESVTQAWNEATVTQNNRPGQFYKWGSYSSVASVSDDDVVDLSTAVNSWVNRGTANHGVAILHDGSIGNYYVQYADRTNSAPGPLPPELYIEYAPPPDAISIPRRQNPITVDAECDPSEYGEGLEVPWISQGGFLSTFWVQHDGDFLYLCTRAEQGFLFLLELDPGLVGGTSPGVSHWQFVADPSDGSSSVLRGGGGIWSPASLAGWQVAAGQPFSTEFIDAAEFKIPLAGIGAGGAVGLALHHQRTSPFSVFGWPRRNSPDNPSTWARADLTLFADGFEAGNMGAWSAASP